MWRPTFRLATATLTATLALAALATVRQADASSVQSYSYTTSGGIAGPSGSPITFNPESFSGTLTTPGTFLLGQFTVNPLPPTATLTYINTPFLIDVNVSPVSSNPYPYSSYGSNNVPAAYQYQIVGMLNGSITGATTGPGTSTMFATVTSITGTDFGQNIAPPFPMTALQINLPQGLAAANGPYSSITTLSAQVLVAGHALPAPAPEPSTVLVFGVGLAGLAWHRRSRSRAKTA